MKGRIIAVVHPFDFKQEIYVFDGKDSLEMKVSVPLGNLADTLLDVSVNQGLDTIVLHGNAKFLENMKEEIVRKEFAQYNQNRLEVIIEND